MIRPDDVLADRFRIVRFIARGGMGEVYEAEDLELGTRVALKTVRRDVAGDVAARERFRREIQLARQVTHRNVCRIFDVFHHSGPDADGVHQEVLGLTMELLSGETLSERLKRQGRMSTEEALPLVIQMASALVSAHDSGVIHRDFKAANVMLVPPQNGDDSPRVVVTDFGLARTSAEGDSGLTADNLAVGTADYMSPEQAEGGEITPASDIYSLGVVLFEMVTGLKPHSGDTPMAVILARLRERVPSPRSLLPDLDRSWDRVIMRCLSYDARDRYQNAVEVVQALTDGGSTVASLLHMVDPKHLGTRRRFGGRHGLLLPSLVVVAVVCAVLAAFWLRSDGEGDLGRLQSSQLTTWQALEVNPVFSPDGRTVAFSSNRDGRFEIFVMQLAPGSRAVQVSSDGAQNFQPTWSPDGSWLAYASHGNGGIWRVPALGGRPRQLSDFGSHPCWSPDGKRIVFQSLASAELSANSVAAWPPSTLWIMNSDGTNPRQLTDPSDPPGGHGAPRWTGDGRYVVFSASERTWSQIWTIDPAGGEPRLLVAGDPIVFDPVPDPSGSTLYYAAISNDEVFGVWRAPVSWSKAELTGTAVRVVHMGMAGIRSFAISSDGKRMVHTALSTVSNLWSLPISADDHRPTGEPAALTAGSGRNSRPVFSPDGRKIAFDRWHTGKGQNIWVMSADGEQLSEVTLDPAVDTLASWMPDGQSLAFYSDRGDRPALWSISLTTGNETLLNELGPEVDWVRLSPEGRRIAFHWATGDRPTNVWTAAVDGSDAQQLSFDREALAYPCWSPNGDWLAVEIRRGENDFLMVMPSVGGEVTELVMDPGKSWPYSWSKDSERVVYAALRDGRWNLYWVSRTTGERCQLTHFDRPDGYVRYPAWSPRGDQIVFELAETAGDLWLVEGLR